MPKSAVACGSVIVGSMMVAAGLLVFVPVAARAEGGGSLVDTAPMLGAASARGVAATMSCQAAVKATGTAVKAGVHAELQARHQAIEGWRTQVAQRYGQDYTHWWRARGKDVTCRGQGAAMHCEALAVPCMLPGGAHMPVAPLSGLGMVERAR